MNIDIKILDERAGLIGPKYATPGSAAMDLIACIDEPIYIHPGAWGLIETGIAIHIEDPTVCAIILPRSGLGHKQGIILGNGTGLIDSDYQGELMVSLWNRKTLGTDMFKLNPGDRIAQLMFIPIVRPSFTIVQEFDATERGKSGFGSTGK